MLTFAIFVICFAIGYGICLLALLPTYSFWGASLLFLACVGIEIVLNAIVALVTCKIFPDKWFDPNAKFFCPSKQECRFYEKIGIRKWKDKNAELGSLNGFRKNKLGSAGDEKYIAQFILECNKGFLDHFASIVVGTLAILALPPKFMLPIGLPIIITNFILNFMPIAILRYNIPRLKVAQKFAARKQKEG